MPQKMWVVLRKEKEKNYDLLFKTKNEKSQKQICFPSSQDMLVRNLE